MKYLFFYFLIQFIPAVIQAQNISEKLPDSTLTEEKATLEISAKQESKAAQYLVPAAMFSFGVLAYEQKALRQINLRIRNEVLEKPRNLRPGIEDILQYTPAHAVFALNFVGLKSQHNLVDRLFLYGLSNTIMSHSVSKLKTISRKLRPDGADRRSFPSGHTATAFSAAEFMRLEYKDVSPIYGIAAYTVAAATGALRVYHNKHWFSDVIAGAGLGILSTDLAYFVYPKIKKLAANTLGIKSEKLNIGPAFMDKKAGFSLVYHP